MERATAPGFRGEGDGALVVLEVPENVPLDFYVVQCARANEGGAVFEVNRSGKAAAALKALGYSRVLNLAGGLGAWQQAGLPVEK